MIQTSVGITWGSFTNIFQSTQRVFFFRCPSNPKMYTKMLLHIFIAKIMILPLNISNKTDMVKSQL